MAWNRPSEKKVEVEGKGGQRNVYLKGLIAGIIVALGAGLAAWLLLRGEAASSPLQKKDRGLIKDVSPVAAPTNAVPAKPIDPREDYDHTKMYRDERGILRYNSGCRAPDPSKPYVMAKTYYDPSKMIFTRTSEQVINRLLTMRPSGRTIFDQCDYYSKSFLDDFKESLKEPIIVREDDSKHAKEVKRAMIEAKKEILDRMRAGESLGDILTQTRKELQRLNDFRRDIEKNIGDYIEERGGTADEQDVKDYVAAANKMLEENGLRKIHESTFVEWNLRLSQKRNNSTSTEPTPTKGRD